MKKKFAYLLCIIIITHAVGTAQIRLDFIPSKHGFHFANNFQTTVDVGGHTDGLCGGMVLAAFNYYRYKMPIPDLRNEDIDFSVNFHLSPVVTSGTTTLIDYIFHSQLATFTNASALSFLGPSDPAYDVEFNKAKARIDRGQYLILGLKMRRNEKGTGHQVLCYGYDMSGKKLFLYDPNFPDKEITLTEESGGIALWDGATVVNRRFGSFFEQQELLSGITSQRTTYDMIDNAINNLNYAVRPPSVASRQNVLVSMPLPANFDAEQHLPAHNIYELKNVAPGKMMEVEDAIGAKGTKVQQYDDYETNGFCDGKNQQWLLIPAGSVNNAKTFHLFNYGFIKYLEAGGDATTQFANNHNNQRWFVRPATAAGKYFIQSVATGEYLEVPNGFFNNGDRLKMSPYTGNANQQFQFNRVGDIHGSLSTFHGRFININSIMNPSKTLNIANASTENGAIVQLYDLLSSAQNEHWRLVRTSDGYYKIQSRLGGNKTIDVTGWEAGNNSNLLIWDNSDVEKQKWLVVPVLREPGSFIFFNKVSGRCMDVAGGVTTNGARIQMYSFVNQNNQKWKLVPVN